MSNNENLDYMDSWWSTDWNDPQAKEAVAHMHDPHKGDTYACIALGACRLRIVELENELSEALTAVRPMGVGLDRVMRIQRDLDKARNQATLLEREYVRQ